MGIFLKIALSRFFPSGLAFSPLFFALLAPPPSAAQWNSLNPVRSSQKDPDGLTIFLERGALRFQVCTGSMIRVLYSPQREFPRVAEYVVINSNWSNAQFDVNEATDSITLTTTGRNQDRQKCAAPQCFPHDPSSDFSSLNGPNRCFWPERQF